ncbi:unnamed protein product [Blepharisma stoltei]|uniref:EF-hand domain-containing protein n=1 Tax=Blepharisma stoltei TaxID=1481888 RepID=A0AAU9JJ73_9CILI|nr:unnamed protein product [Blepharisma stoltei]
MGNISQCCENSKLQATIFDLNEENKKLKKRESDEQHSKEQLKILYDKLLSEKEASNILITNQLNILKNDNISLTQRNERLKARLIDGCQDKAALDFLAQEYEEKLKKLDSEYSSKIQELSAETQKLRVELMLLTDSHKRRILWGALKYMKKYSLQNLSASIDRWKEILEDPEHLETEGSVMFKTIEFDVTSIYDDDDNKVNQAGVKAALDMLSEEQKATISENPLMIYYEAHRGRGEKPMSIQNVFRFFEEMLDKKYEADCADLEAKRAPRTMPDYMMDHLIRVYGLKKIAHKALCQIIPTLEELNKKRHSLGILFSRLIQVIHHDPIPYQLALFLTKARIEFNKLVTNALKDMKTRNIEAKAGKSDNDGAAFLIDVMNLIYNLFDTDRGSRGKAISLLKPERFTSEQFMVFRICHKIIRMGETAENVFAGFDVDRKDNEISRDQLIEGMRKELELAMPEDEATILFNVLDPKNTGKISRDTFLQKIDIKSHYENCKSLNLTIKKSKFWMVLIDVYKTVQIKDAAFLMSWFNSQGKTHLNFDEFKNYVLLLDPDLFPEEIQSYYDDGLRLNADASLDGLTSESFCKVIIRESIGGKGVRDFKLKSGGGFAVRSLSRKNSDLNLSQDDIQPPTPKGKHSRRMSGLGAQPPTRSRTPTLEMPTPKHRKRGSFTGLPPPASSKIPIPRSREPTKSPEPRSSQTPEPRYSGFITEMRQSEGVPRTSEEPKSPDEPKSPRFGWQRSREFNIS